MMTKTLEPTSTAARPSRFKGRLGAGTTLAMLAVMVLLPVVLPSATLATEILIFAMAALACNLLLGFTGLLSFGQAIFFGAGAYISALAMIHLNAGLVGALLIAVVVGAVLALGVGMLCIRRKGIYFVMLTLALTQMAYFLAYTLSDWTGGDNGLLDVPRPPLAVGDTTLISFDSPLAFYALVAVLFAVIYVVARRITDSPFGSTLLAIRENEQRASALGYDTRLFKVMVFVLSGGITALAGALYGMLLNFVPLSNIELLMSEQILIMTIIGGTGSLFGSLLGAGAIVLLGDLLSSIWPRWMLLLGVALIAVVIFMRGGLWGGLSSLLERRSKRIDGKEGDQ
ncbi:branched-chain amino acid ABC transporter permease [Halomonas denitrificans]|uniref:branched-chain amino acid ABC transporter permease n=1 Tax=Halomonas denitrificans TaxID=370769 RepID=UPI001CD818B9|nr:branched-chain amino acid ABC transporter permease [Halomonas denitrificans]MCA0974386.1 branched-chain amino acid ABC transporter permease [Halomonas denitrificans]